MQHKEGNGACTNTAAILLSHIQKHLTKRSCKI